MPITCVNKIQYGKEFCTLRCPVASPDGAYRYVRVELPEDIPPVDERAVDVAVLDMNHGWPNLGHDSIVRAVRDTACDLQPGLQGTGLYLRVISYDVRRKLMVPEPPGNRFAIYLGTGGPGHIDPVRNNGTSAGSQGVRENPSWEKPLFSLFDAIREDPNASLLAVCHTFGVICKWSGAARAVLRGSEKGGKASGVLENILSREALSHPWFGRFAGDLPDGRRLRVVDNRLFDLLEGPEGLPSWITLIARDTSGIGGPEGEALTMLEFARDRGGTMPRIFAANHHPEIVDRPLLLTHLNEKLVRREVSAEWYEERAKILEQTAAVEDNDRLLGLTSRYTFAAPLQFHLFRQIRQRAEALGTPVRVHEDRVLEQAGLAAA